MTSQKYSEIYFGIFRIFGKIFIMLEQITGEVVTDDQEQPSPKGKLAAMKKAKDDAIAEAEKKKKLLTPQRTIEVADSLSKEGVLKLTSLIGFRKDKEKAGTYANKYMSDKFLDSLDNDANKDISNSVRYRSLALKAMGKNK